MFHKCSYLKKKNSPSTFSTLRTLFQLTCLVKVFYKCRFMSKNTSHPIFRPRTFCSSLTRDDCGWAKNIKHSAQTTIVLSIVGETVGLLQILLASKLLNIYIHHIFMYSNNKLNLNLLMKFNFKIWNKHKRDVIMDII